MTTSDKMGRDLPIRAGQYRGSIGAPENYDAVAAIQFSLLTFLGLREHHFLLDIGCGGLRAGKLFIPYLLTSHYFRIEAERWLVEEEIQNDLGRAILEIKKPVFAFDRDFDCRLFKQQFDFVIAPSVIPHASQQQIRRYFSKVGACMNPASVWAATFVKGNDDYHGNEWVYPDCVAYTVERLQSLAVESGLEANLIDWPHPNGQCWLILTRPGSANVASPLWNITGTKKIYRKVSSEVIPGLQVPTCIIGMHRSGTSMVARLLNQCGLNLGPDESLLGASADNALGHFEHTEFLEINNALLKHLRGSWDQPPIVDLASISDADLAELVAKAEKLIGSFAGSSPWGWKDPRTTLVLPFWRQLLPNLRYVICIRNPLDVARSLQTRDGMSLTAAAELWTQYTLAALEGTEDCPRIIMFYEDFFRDSVAEVARLLRFCRLQRIDKFPAVQSTIVRELRHQNTGIVDLLNDESIPLRCKMFYLCLRLGSAGEFREVTTDKGVPPEKSDVMSKLFRLFSDLQNEELLLQLQTKLCLQEYQLKGFERRMLRDLDIKNQQISQLQEQNATLKRFADAVRNSLVYRLYKGWLRPLGEIAAIKKL